MYRHFFRICGDPNRAKYALCIFDSAGLPFIRTYQTFARYCNALAHYLSRPEIIAVSFSKCRGQWIYWSLSHTLTGSTISDITMSLLDSARRTATAHVDSCMNGF